MNVNTGPIYALFFPPSPPHSESLCYTSAPSHCKEMDSNKLTSILCLPCVDNFCNRNNECIYSYLFPGGRYPLVKSERSRSQWKLEDLSLTQPLPTCHKAKTKRVLLDFCTLRRKWVFFFIKIGKIKEKRLVISKLFAI